MFRYLASGDSMTSMHYQYLMGLSTVSAIISETCAVLWKKLCPMVLPSTVSTEEWLRIAQTFSDTWNFPHCIGAIDGKHVVIQVRFLLDKTEYIQLNSLFRAL